jgi:hypothetical protein
LKFELPSILKVKFVVSEVMFNIPFITVQVGWTIFTVGADMGAGLLMIIGDDTATQVVGLATSLAVTIYVPAITLLKTLLLWKDAPPVILYSTGPVAFAITELMVVVPPLQFIVPAVALTLKVHPATTSIDEDAKSSAPTFPDGWGPATPQLAPPKNI